MVVGAKGAVIGEVGIGARKDLEAVLNKRIHLILEVKVSARVDALRSQQALAQQAAAVHIP